MINKDLIVVSDLINSFDNILIGAGAGLSTAAGFDYGGERFDKYFSDFKKKYHFEDMYSGSFYPFKTPEEFWAFMSRNIYINRYMDEHLELYRNLHKLIEDKNYFVITTNVDHCFQKSGFNKKRLFYTQGDYGLFQCSIPCHNKTYDNYEIIKEMVEKQKDMKIPTGLIPVCPKCGKEMTNNLRSDNRFVEDNGWHEASVRYQNYLDKYAQDKILFMDLGVGGNTPGIIKYPFWQMTAANPEAIYLCINRFDAVAPDSIMPQSVLIAGDLKEVIDDLVEIKESS